MSTTTVTPEDQYSPDSTETCDRCGPGTRASWLVRVGGGGILTFCGSCHRNFRKAATAPKADEEAPS